ncbi:MAG: hypothetical protein ACAI44_13470 [Candidatus Sericytochromatia bacterium]
MKLLATILSLLLSLPAQAAPAEAPAHGRRGLALIPVLQQDASQSQAQIQPECTNAMYRTLMRQPAYALLPDWYVLSRLEQDPVRWQSDWSGLFSRLPEAELAILNHLEAGPDGQQLVGILVEQGPPARILRAEVMSLQGDELAGGCERMARRLLGQPEPETFRSPALSAMLSLLVPGTGHLYRGGVDGIAMGAGFLGAYLVMSYLGFSDGSSPTVTRSQWGGLLLLLTFADVVTAYFLVNN